MRNVLVIPARMGSTRFPGKPLTQVAGHTLIRRVHALASAVEAIDRVLVATDDPRIADHVASFGGEAVMTGESCRNGTERVLEAVAELDPKPEVVINLQGDAVLTPPWILEDLVAAFADPAIDVATPAVRLSKTAFAELRAAKAKGDVGGTFVVMDCSQHALYFSKSPIPHSRSMDALDETPPFFQHIGTYAYRLEALKRWVAFPPTPLEQLEQLEQLRALEHGMRIRMVVVDYRGRDAGSIDTPTDVIRVERLIATQGELVPL